MTVAAGNVGDTDDLSRISPELVLVDPELSRRVRARVPLSFRRRRPPRPALHLSAESPARTGPDEPPLRGNPA